MHESSLGSVPAIYTASQAVSYDLGGLVLIAPVASGVRCLTASDKIPYLTHLIAPVASGVRCLTASDKIPYLTHPGHERIRSRESVHSALKFLLFDQRKECDGEGAAARRHGREGVGGTRARACTKDNIKAIELYLAWLQ